MFKKAPTIKTLSPLRSSDRRRLADQIIKEYLQQPTPSEAGSTQTPEERAEAQKAHTALRSSLLPDNTQAARFTTTHGPDLKQVSGTVYVGSHDGEEARILWFTVEGRMYPSVHTLWRTADLVPLLLTPDAVVKKLQGGADLMTPGLAGGPPFPETAKKDAVVTVASTERPSVPIMVGYCEIDVSAVGEVTGAKGHAVINVHWVGDEAWGFGETGRAVQPVPEEIEGWRKVLESRGLVEKLEPVDLAEGGVRLEESHQPDARNNEGTNGKMGPAESAKASQANETTGELSTREIDLAYRSAFLYGIHSHKTANSNTANYGLVFPLSQSFVMSNLIQPFLPASVPDIKKSSFKNVKKFIKSMNKETIVKSKDQDGNQTVILDIDFNDDAILGFQPYALPKKEPTAGTAEGRGGMATEKTDVGDPSIGQNLRVLTYLRPTAKLQPFFSAAEKQLLAPPEVRQLITSYIETENLISETNKRMVKLNPTLAHAVFDGSGSLDKEVIAKGSVPRDALIDRVKSAMASSHAILRAETDLSTIKAKSGAPPKIHITLETRSGNKTATKVSGLEAYFVTPKLLADELRKVCAGSASVEPVPGGSKKTEKPVEQVMIQGPQTAAVIKALERRGVEAKWTEVEDKTKGKKR